MRRQCSFLLLVQWDTDCQLPPISSDSTKAGPWSLFCFEPLSKFPIHLLSNPSDGQNIDRRHINETQHQHYIANTSMHTAESSTLVKNTSVYADQLATSTRAPADVLLPLPFAPWQYGEIHSNHVVQSRLTR
eukprot:scpid103576/ scgid27343/ 